jgi:hypothetical protein
VGRNFNGSSAVKMSAGAITTFAFGTIAVVLRVTTGGSSFRPITSADTSNANSLFLFTNDSVNLQLTAGFVAAPTITAPATDGWILLAASKGTGSVPVRFHKYVFSTNVWTHENAASSSANSSTTTQSTFTFANTSGGFVGDIAIGAAFVSQALSDAQIETLPFSVQSWMALAPSALWLFDQQATTENVLDLTGGGANQSLLTGTTVSTASVPVLSYGHPVITGSVRATAVSGSVLSSSGTSSGIGTTTGFLTGTTSTSGVSAGIGSSTGSGFRSVNSAGSSTSLESSSGSLQRSVSATGSSTGIEASSGTALGGSDLAGTTAGSGSSSASLTSTTTATGTSLGVATSTGSITRSSASGSTAAGSGASGGVLQAVWSAAGTSAGSGSTSAVAGRSIPTSGISAGAGSSSGSVLGGGDLTGTSVGTAASTGSLQRSISVSGTSSGTSSTTAAGYRLTILSGVTAASGTAVGSLLTSAAMAGVATGSGGSTGSLVAGVGDRYVLARGRRSRCGSLPTSGWSMTCSIRRKHRHGRHHRSASPARNQRSPTFESLRRQVPIPAERRPSPPSQQERWRGVSAHPAGRAPAADLRHRAEVGDVVTITAAGRDQDLVGRVLRIRDLMTKTDSTARRVQVEEITS